MGKIRYDLVRSSLCAVGVVTAEKRRAARIIRIFLSGDSDAVLRRIRKHFPEGIRGRNRKIGSVSERIQAYLKGGKVCFGSLDAEIDTYSRFQRDISLAAMKIPAGKVMTYKHLAGLAGIGSARAAGNAMARNPFPVIVPCHRVVNATREVGGFQSGKPLKKKLLAAEGVRFDGKGRVLRKFFVSYPLGAMR